MAVKNAHPRGRIRYGHHDASEEWAEKQAQAA